MPFEKVFEVAEHNYVKVTESQNKLNNLRKLKLR